MPTIPTGIFLVRNDAKYNAKLLPVRNVINYE